MCRGRGWRTRSARRAAVLEVRRRAHYAHLGGGLIRRIVCQFDHNRVLDKIELLGVLVDRKPRRPKRALALPQPVSEEQLEVLPIPNEEGLFDKEGVAGTVCRYVVSTVGTCRNGGNCGSGGEGCAIGTRRDGGSCGSGGEVCRYASQWWQLW